MHKNKIASALGDFMRENEKIASVDLFENVLVNTCSEVCKFFSADSVVQERHIEN